jgi:molybdopterin synthase catalytic subunit
MIIITEAELDIESLTNSILGDENGAVNTFLGVTRNSTAGRPVIKLEYECYLPMAQKILEAIRIEALEKWEVSSIAIGHRIGNLGVGETSLVVAVSGPHRSPVFEVCKYIVDRIKEVVPIWKKEFFQDGAVWVDSTNCESKPD